ncbi:MAG: AmmeMemoRadiSam system protein A [Desulfarculus sp.]|nr:AmmeMemoRadiSam system protein A [Pseudomonadota bacterium]MBV1715411.1 AmmeMemoRadiSam system protein A [Desulfarculus sp.]MBU4574667.1 AmmeMemoRadiSam system protein A [Pseudomonadota bacterium]MBU4596242.1 AmmeMemoRadiSam system protein A [Pseudomonadota bacterium]MBV1737606.1 AmmeMemoRadiSam system protein A [Desulfarculus sp.]
MSEHELSPKEQKALLELARGRIARLVGREGDGPAKDELPGPEMKRGAFVTLHKQGRLRGCIGNFISDEPLTELIQDMAVAAASQDPRFPPLGAAELDQVDLEISVLSPLKRISDVNEIKVGTHGIYMVSPRGRGVLLPQVATEYGWDRDTFLDQTCVKAGLRPGCWRDPDTEILIFSAQIFGEKEAG